MITVEEKEKIEEYLEENLKKNENPLNNIRSFMEEPAVRNVIVDIGASLLRGIMGDAEEQTAGNQPETRGGSSRDKERKVEIAGWMSDQKKEHEGFADVLQRRLEEKGYKDRYPDFYNKIGMDRRLFSKLSSTTNSYRAEKKTIFKLLIGLELDLELAEELLGAGGYTFNNYDQYDLIIKYCIEQSTYTLEKVDEYLILFGEKPLFSL